MQAYKHPMHYLNIYVKNKAHVGFIYFVVFFITYIWKIPNKLDTVQYNTKPAGIHANNTVNNTGIHFITRWVDASASFALFCVCGVCKYCCSHIVAPIKIGNMKYGSITDKSDIQRKCADRIGTDINNAL